MIRDRFSDNIKKYLSEDEWIVVEDGYNSLENLNYETIFAMASGKMGLRATHPEGWVKKTLPANYMHGVFDRSEAFQRELCNLPNFNILKIYYKTEPISVEYGAKTEDYIRVLDLKNGILAKHYINESYDGRKTLVETLQFLSRKHPNSGLLKYFITPLNYSGKMEFENIIDGSVTNFYDFPRFRVKHMNIKEVGKFSNNGIYINSETRDFKLQVTTSSKVKIIDKKTQFQIKSHGEYAIEFFDCDFVENETLIIEKYSCVRNGNETDNTKLSSEKELEEIYVAGFENELEEHIMIYNEMWEMADIKIKGDPESEKAVKFEIFHLMSTPNPESSMTNIGAKMIHGEEYGGHAFWDTELFILPYFIWTFPKIAKNLVEYRYNLLDSARRNARKYGYKGARFPWESADTGDEECPDWTIEGDGTCYECVVAKQEIHVTSAVVYGGYQYYKVTEDKDYFYNKFLEILAETSRYFIDRLEYSKEKDCYELTNVMGPDEWHENVSNNVYTNYIVKWHLNLANELLMNHMTNEIVKNMLNKINMSYEEVINFKKISEKIYLPLDDKIIEQFDGYFNLKDIEIYQWDKNNMPLLPKELKEIPREQTTINKQADVVMVMFLFPENFSEEVQRKNFDFYEKRTLQRSSLSPSIFSIVGNRVGSGDRAYDYFLRSAFVDLKNNQGNTREGMHAASAGGVWQSLILGFAGMSIEKGELQFSPKLPKKWKEIEFSIIHKSKINKVNITSNNKVKIKEKGMINGNV